MDAEDQRSISTNNSEFVHLDGNELVEEVQQQQEEQTTLFGNGNNGGHDHQQGVVVANQDHQQQFYSLNASLLSLDGIGGEQPCFVADQIRNSIGQKIEKKELATKVELKDVQIELYKMGHKLNEKMDNIKETMNNANGQCLLDLGLLERMITERMAPMQQKIDQLSKENGELKNAMMKNEAVAKEEMEQLWNEFMQWKLDDSKSKKEDQLEKVLNLDNSMNNKWVHKNQWEQWGARLHVSGCLGVKYANQQDNEWHSVRAKFVFSPSSEECRICYYEIEITKKFQTWGIAIGLCTSEFPMQGEGVGDAQNSFGYNSGGIIGIDNCWDHDHRAEWAYGKGHVVGCGLEITGCRQNNGQRRQVFFTRDGQLCGRPIVLPVRANGLLLFPAVSLYYKGEEIEANFGHKPFKYNLAKHGTTE